MIYNADPNWLRRRMIYDLSFGRVFPESPDACFMIRAISTPEGRSGGKYSGRFRHLALCILREGKHHRWAGDGLLLNPLTRKPHHEATPWQAVSIALTVQVSTLKRWRKAAKTQNPNTR